MITTEEYFKKLQYHDWFYEYSDDHSVWKKGLDARGELQNLAKESDLFATMFSEYLAYINAVIKEGPNQEEVARPVLEDYV